MILEFTKSDLLEYIDKEEIQETIKSQVEWTIKEQVKSILKDENVLKTAVVKLLEKTISEDLELGKKVKEALEERLFESIKILTDWDFTYYAGLKEKITEIVNRDESQIKCLLTKRVLEGVDNVEITEWDIRNIILGIVKNSILNNEDKFNTKKTLEEFVEINLDRVINKLLEC
jgi:hypothetical protein